MRIKSNHLISRPLHYRYCLGVLLFLAVAGFLLWEEHKVHVLENSVLLLIFGVCGAAYFFVHGGRDHGHDKSTVVGGEERTIIEEKDMEK